MFWWKMFILNLVFVHKYQSIVIQRCTLESIAGKGYGEGEGLRKKCVRVLIPFLILHMEHCSTQVDLHNSQLDTIKTSKP